MQINELTSRYGQHVAARLQQELMPSEISLLLIERLPSFLQERAEAAHDAYKERLANPFINDELGEVREEYIEVLRQRWLQAEELAYLIEVAEDVAANARQNLAS